MEQHQATKVSFRAFSEATAEDLDVIAAEGRAFNKQLPDRILTHLRLLEHDFGGFAVDRLTHSLQTATRAARANRDDAYVVCALVHDIGDLLGSFNHADIAAAVVKPFVSDEYHWMVEQHAIFQGYFFFDKIGLDPNMRDQFAGHPWFDLCAEFCAEYDEPAFDGSYPTMPLDEFEPLVRAFFARPLRSIYLKSDRLRPAGDEPRR